MKRFPSECTFTEVNEGHVSLEWPPNGKLRARKVVTRSRARATGKYPSWKMGRMIQWESVNELNAYRLLDADPTVTAYYEQPLIIRFTHHGEVHHHYPDTLVQWAPDMVQELWEVKPAANAAQHEYIARTKLLERALPQLGFRYKLVVAEELAREPRLSNVLSVLRYGRAPVPSLAREQIRRKYCEAAAPAWGAVLNGALGKHGRNYVCRLILEGTLVLNLELPLTSSATLAWREPTLLR